MFTLNIGPVEISVTFFSPIEVRVVESPQVHALPDYRRSHTIWFDNQSRLRTYPST